ncbi:MAG: NAD(P)/FAD-dependent oxidoreductase, partial [Candidatus Binatia bacterium]
MIVGAGFAGAATAYHLTRRGVADVVVVEAEGRPGAHASGRNASLVFQLLKDPEEARLVMEGARFYEKPPEGFSERPLFRRCGSLLVASREGAKDLEAAARDAGALGLAVGIFNAADAVARVPVLEGSPIEVALENPADGVVDIVRLLEGYLSAAVAGGARIRYGARVTRVETSGGRVSAVVAGGERIACRCLVNAAGAWAGEVGELAGAGTRSIEAFRRHIFQTEPDRRIDPAGPFVWHDDIDVYFRPEAGGFITSACDTELHPPADVAVDPRAERLLREKLAAAFPKLASARIASSRACLRTFAADGRPLIGRDPELEGLVWVAALGGHGMSAS